MWIKHYILTIISVVIFTTVAESLMPDSSFKKHISLINGLVILLAISKPVISLSNIDVDSIINSLNYSQENFENNISEILQDVQQNQINKEFSDSLAEAISKSINQTCGVKCQVKVDFDDGDIKNIQIMNSENEIIKSHVKNVYGLECEFKGEE